MVDAGGDIAAVRVGEGPRGRGLFAARPIAKGEAVLEAGELMHVVHSDTRLVYTRIHST